MEHLEPEQLPETPDLKKKKQKRRLSKTGRIVVICVLVLVTVGLVFGAIALNRILNRPETLFETSTLGTSAPMAEPAAEDADLPTAEPAAEDADLPTPTPGIDQVTKGKDIVNILLIGTDAEEKTYSDDTHADVMMVVAVNFEENKVDLISLPRDSFGPLPGVRGFYKLNASFNVGGGLKGLDGAAFDSVCAAASYQLGGIAVDYYYSVNFGAVVALVDSIGGIDYDVDALDNIPQRTITKLGMQHLTGRQVLEYLRIRHTGNTASDLGRVDRQKRMMISMFRQFKEKNILAAIPTLLNTEVTGFHTNTTLAQTTALANYALKIDPDSIGMHTMPGQLRQTAYTPWNFVFTLQDERVALIEEVYGVTVDKQIENTYVYLLWLEAYGFDALHALALGDEVEGKINETLAASGADMTEEQRDAYDNYKAKYEDLRTSCEYAGEQLIVNPHTSTRASRAPVNKLSGFRKAFKDYAKALGYEETLNFNVPRKWWTDPYINEVNVDFR